MKNKKNKAGRYKDSHRPSVISSRVDPSSLQPPASSPHVLCSTNQRQVHMKSNIQSTGKFDEVPHQPQLRARPVWLAGVAGYGVS